MELWNTLDVIGNNYFLLINWHSNVGTLSGSMIPMILNRCRQAPAASSAPFLATFEDVTGLIIYFSVDSIILKGVLL